MSSPSGAGDCRRESGELDRQAERVPSSHAWTMPMGGRRASRQLGTRSATSTPPSNRLVPERVRAAPRVYRTISQGWPRRRLRGDPSGGPARGPARRPEASASKEYGPETATTVPLTPPPSWNTAGPREDPARTWVAIRRLAPRAGSEAAWIPGSRAAPTGVSGSFRGTTVVVGGDLVVPDPRGGGVARRVHPLLVGRALVHVDDVGREQRPRPRRTRRVGAVHVVPGHLFGLVGVLEVEDRVTVAVGVQPAAAVTVGRV